MSVNISKKKIKDVYGERHKVKETRGNSYLVGGGNTTFIHKSKAREDNSSSYASRAAKNKAAFDSLSPVDKAIKTGQIVSLKSGEKVQLDYRTTGGKLYGSTVKSGFTEGKTFSESDICRDELGRFASC